MNMPCADPRSDQAIESFKDLFLQACPKYLSVNPPPYEDPSALESYLASPPQDAVQRHLDLFLSDVAAVQGVSSLRNLLKLYTSIDAAKLAAFSVSSEAGKGSGEEEVLQQLMALKAASRTYAKQGEGSLVDGERIVTNNLDFTIDSVSRALPSFSAPRTVIMFPVYGPRRGDNFAQAIRRLLHPQCRARSASFQHHPGRSLAVAKASSTRHAGSGSRAAARRAEWSAQGRGVAA
jgi:translation initiation factor 3 subunit L